MFRRFCEEDVRCPGCGYRLRGQQILPATGQIRCPECGFLYLSYLHEVPKGPRRIWIPLLIVAPLLPAVAGTLLILALSASVGRAAYEFAGPLATAFVACTAVALYALAYLVLRIRRPGLPLRRGRGAHLLLAVPLALVLILVGALPFAAILYQILRDYL